MRELTQFRDGIEGLAVEPRRDVLAVTSSQCREVRLDAERDLAAVTRRAAAANRSGVEQQRRATGARRLARRGEPGVAGADDDDVGAGRQRLDRTRRERRIVAPQRPRRVVWRKTHPPPPSALPRV